MTLQSGAWLSAFYESKYGASKSNVNFEEHNEERREHENETAVKAEETTFTMSTTGGAPVNEHSDIPDAMMQQDDLSHTADPCCSSTLLPAPAGYYFFKGYLTWSCLWGHIPVCQSELTRPLFTDAEVDASFGRNTGSCAALKRRADSTAAGPATPNNARKRLPPVNDAGGASSTSLCDSTITITTPSSSSRQSGVDTARNVAGMMGILTRTLAFVINGESLENELQKNALLKIKRVREKIHATNRKHDHQLSNSIYRSENCNDSI